MNISEWDFSILGLYIWDLVFLGFFIGGIAATVFFGAQRAYRALFGLGAGFLFYIVSLWFFWSLPAFWLEVETLHFFERNKILFLQISWGLIFILPIISILIPVLSLDIHFQGTIWLFARSFFLPFFFCSLLFSIMFFSVEQKFPFPFLNLLSHFHDQLGWEKTLFFGFFLKNGVFIMGFSVFLAFYFLFFAPIMGTLIDQVNALRLPTFFKDAQKKKKEEGLSESDVEKAHEHMAHH